MANKLIYGPNQIVGVPVTSTGKSNPTNDGTLAYAQGAALFDNSGAAIGPANPLPVTVTGGGGSDELSTGQVAISATAIIVAARAGRGSVVLVNDTGTAEMFFGPAGVTTANGIYMPAVKGASLSLDTSAAVHGVSAGAAQTISFAETY